MAEELSERDPAEATRQRSGLTVGVLWLLGCQVAGQVVVELLRVPVPAPVVGMVLLFVRLRRQRPGGDDGTVRVADLVLRHLQLLFIPAGVGVVVYLHTIAHHALPIVVALALSWAVGLAVVGWTAAALGRWRSA